jgi:hypothetical protein
MLVYGVVDLAQKEEGNSNMMSGKSASAAVRGIEA